MKGKGSGSGVKVFVIGLILAGLVLGYFFYLSVRNNKDKDEETQIGAVQEVLMRNLDKNYPPSPREVLKYFGEITQCFYGEEYTEEEFYQLAMKIQELYDAELTANKTEEQYLEDLRWDISQLKDQNTIVSSYSLPSSTDVEFFSRDGYSWARLYVGFTLRTGTELGMSNEVFLLRRDEDGHWKIYGWQLEEQTD
ncbi:MAG: hypothetical protein NC429_00125 [Lachnospiraceae bacterium]|nr:hypothetical protein [Lachnospiraceae bacterium]